GVGNLLPKGADVVLQVHYHRSGKEEKDRTRIGLYFAKKPVDQKIRSFPLLYFALRIPPGDPNYTVRTGMTVPADVTLRSVTPHLPLLGKKMTVPATLPGGEQKTLVRVSDYDFNWQTIYTYREPVRIPRGTRIDLVARYDNSEKNPRNPSHPPRLVT